MNEETIAQKITSLQRCISQARKFMAGAAPDFATDHLSQDAAVLNVIRACEASIDLANIWIRKDKLGMPTESRDSFRILVRENRLDPVLGERLQKMVGFRNLAVHRYEDLDIAIVQSVIRSRLDDLLDFGKKAHSSLMP